MAKGSGTLSISKPRSRIPPAELLSLFNPVCIFIIFFNWFPLSFIHLSLLVPTPLSTPEVAGGATSWDLRKSLFNFPFDNRVKHPSARVWCEANFEGDRPAHCEPSSGSWLKSPGLWDLGIAKAFKYKDKYFLTLIPRPTFLTRPRKLRGTWLTPQSITLVNSSLAISTRKALYPW